MGIEQPVGVAEGHSQLSQPASMSCVPLDAGVTSGGHRTAPDPSGATAPLPIVSATLSFRFACPMQRAYLEQNAGSRTFLKETD